MQMAKHILNQIAARDRAGPACAGVDRLFESAIIRKILNNTWLMISLGHAEWGSR